MKAYIVGLLTIPTVVVLWFIASSVIDAVSAYAHDDISGGGWHNRFGWECQTCKSLCYSRPVASWIPRRIARRPALWHLRREHVHFS